MPKKGKRGNKWIKTKTSKKTKGEAETIEGTSIQASNTTLYQPIFLRILHGDYSQGDGRFAGNAGKQCTANAAVACAFEGLKPVSNWQSGDINLILNSGNTLYAESRAIRNVQHEYLTVSELNQNFRILNENINIDSLLDQSINGQLKIHLGDFSRSLTNGLCYFFERFHCGIITTNDRSVAVIKDDTRFSYFDSHSVDERGLYSAGGRACVISFDTINNLKDCLLANLYLQPTDRDNYQHNVYTLVPIIVTRQPTVTQDRPHTEYMIPDSAPIAHSIAQFVQNPSKSQRRKRKSKDQPQTDRISDSVSLPPPLVENIHKPPPAADYKNVIQHDLGPMSETCKFCLAKFFRDELQFCCGHGKVFLHPDPDYPTLIKDLLFSTTDGSNHPHWKNFKDNICIFNNMFAFASVGANIITHHGVGLGSMYVIQGKMYHAVQDIDISESAENLPQPPQYGHLYFLDSDRASTFRAQTHQQCVIQLIHELEDLFRNINPYAERYLHLRERANTDPQPANLGLRLLEPNAGNHRYNLPQVPHEVGVVFRADTEGNPPVPHDLCICLRSAQPNRLKFINVLNSLADPLCYPVLFPLGQPGWNSHIVLANPENRKRTRLSRLEHIAYKVFSIRDSRECHIINFGKLTQQYIVDVYVKVETDRLNYLRYNQSNLRSHKYDGLLDYLQNAAERQNITVGRSIILPTTFIGGPRSIQQHYQDAMAIVAKYGRPDLFITFTCNPKWPEIKSNVKSWEESHNRVDLICRVFRQKLKIFMRDVTEKQIFGKMLAYVYVIEFQKRGLPHCHLLVTLSNASKFREPHQVDEIISAEIPDETDDPVLFKSVQSHMIHGPCGARYDRAPCMNDDGLCKKNFPKPFSDMTTISEDSFPRYRRRDNRLSPFDVKRGHQIFKMDNSAVVPYNPYLIKKFDCHINIEVCSSVKGVKYIFKYVHKGHDCALLRIDLADGIYDEISQYVDARYVSSSEACWRLLKFPLHETSHTVVRLLFHLPDQKVVSFIEGEEQEAFNKAASSNSMFEAWFILNSEDHRARDLLYIEIPYIYRYDIPKRRWIARIYRKGYVDGSKIITRMYTISPKDRELFHMRLLLLHVRGARSYEELRTVNGTVFQTFEAAAREMGLLADDTEWDKCMREGVLFKMPGQLRKLFAYILVCCTVANPRQLWEDYRADLIQDFTRKGYDVHTAETKALFIIQRIVQNAGGKFDTYDLPSVDNVINDCDLLDDSVVDADVNVDGGELRDTVQANQDRFNSGQRDVYEAVMRAIDSGDVAERLFFLDGPGGTGKTFVYNTILDELHLRRKTFVSVAWTGIAAILLRGGRTVHSRFRLPLNVNSATTSSLTIDSAEAQELRTAEIVVWDEVTMANVHAFHAVDRLFRDITRDQRPFGGKVVLLGGDFRQCLPILPRAAKTAVIEICLINSAIWKQFKHYRLTENMRAERHEVEFAEWLIRLGDGRLTNTYNELNSSEIVPIPSQCIVSDIITAVYGNIATYTAEDYETFQNRVILSPKNDGCDSMNIKILDKIPGDGVSYYSADTILTDDEQEAANFTTEFLNSLTPSGMPPHHLTLKVGVPIMLVRNICIAEGLCNGTRLVVRRLLETLIQAEISMGHFRGSRVLIPRMDLTSDATTLPFSLQRRQFPVRVCFAMTINKAQGQTFDRVGIYLPNPVFAHGQLYVAFSRVKSWESVKVEIHSDRTQGQLKKKCTTIYTKNVVYRNLLARVNED